jgi:hypothetical protein
MFLWVGHTAHCSMSYHFSLVVQSSGWRHSVVLQNMLPQYLHPRWPTLFRSVDVFLWRFNDVTYQKAVIVIVNHVITTEFMLNYSDFFGLARSFDDDVTVVWYSDMSVYLLQKCHLSWRYVRWSVWITFVLLFIFSWFLAEKFRFPLMWPFPGTGTLSVLNKLQKVEFFWRSW